MRHSFEKNEEQRGGEGGRKTDRKADKRGRKNRKEGRKEGKKEGKKRQKESEGRRSRKEGKQTKDVGGSNHYLRSMPNTMGTVGTYLLCLTLRILQSVQTMLTIYAFSLIIL